MSTTDGSKPIIVADDELKAALEKYGIEHCRAASIKVMGGKVSLLSDVPQQNRLEFLAVLQSLAVSDTAGSNAEQRDPKLKPENDAQLIANGSEPLAPASNRGPGVRDTSRPNTLEAIASEHAASPPSVISAPGAQLEHARLLVERLVAIAGDNAGKFIVCAYGEGIKEVRQVLNGPHAVEQIINALGNLAAIKNANVYILPALVLPNLPEGRRGQMADVVVMLALVTDFDRHEGPPIDWMANMPISPHHVCETSPGNFQCWIFFDRPYHPDDVRSVAKALVKCTNCDPVTADMDHVFRASGSLNYPNAKKLKEGRAVKPFQSQLVMDAEWYEGVTLAELRAAILKAKPDAFELNVITGPSKAKFDWDQRKKPDEPCDLLSDEAIARALTKEGDRSALAFKLILRLQRANYSAEEIVSTLLNFSSLPVLGHYGDPFSEARLRDDVLRAFNKSNQPIYEQGTAAAFRIPNTTDIATEGTETEPKPLREIKVRGGARPENVSDAEAALIEQHVGVFQRGNLIVRPAEIKVEVRAGMTAGDLLLVSITAPALIEHMTSAAKFLRWDARSVDWKRIDCPREIADALLARGGDWNLRVLAGIITAPTLRPDGSLLGRPGYDAATGLLFDPRGVVFPLVPTEPKKDDALRSLAIFDELIEGFPFASKEARTVALAAFLTICIRRTLPTAPLFGIDGSGPGSGKGLLADTIATVGSGRPASPITSGADEEELEKRLNSMLMRGDLAISIDNLNGPLESTFLCSVLTQQKQSVRVLGQSKVVTVPTNCFLMATANGLTYAGDMWRRGLNCLVDPAMERPSERVFSFNPVERAMQNRGRYVAAALTVLRAYQVAGMPPQSGRPMGSFETWSHVVRDALLWLGQADPVATCIPLLDDPDRERFAAVIRGWQSVIGEDRGVTLKEAIETATRAASAAPQRPELLDAFHAVAAPMVRSDIRIDPRRLGAWLRTKKRQVIRGLRLMPEGESAAGMRWRLEKARGNAD